MKTRILVLLGVLAPLVALAQAPARPAASAATPADEAKLIGVYTCTRFSNRTVVVNLEASDSDGKGAISPAQMQALQVHKLTLTVRSNHTLVVSNFPSPTTATNLMDISGRWSLKPYRVMDASRHLITVSGGTQVQIIRAEGHTSTLPSSEVPFLGVTCKDAAGKFYNLSFKKISDNPGQSPESGKPRLP